MTVIDQSRLAPQTRNFPISPELERLLKAAGQSASVSVTIRAAQDLFSPPNRQLFGRHLSNRISEARVRDQRSGANRNALAQGRGGA